MTLGELNKNISNQGKSAKKLASGMKINSAGDDASAYSISERMRAQLRSLDQDIDNVKNGRALLKVAAGGIDNIVDELRNLKELALNAANDTNTDEDRATIQKEFDQKMANINDIAQETNYNGKILLDGRYGCGKEPPRLREEFPLADEPRGTVQTISASAGNITISDGVYEIAQGYTGTITIANNAQNVKIKQANPSVELNEVFIEGPASGNANLWIEDLNIKNMTDKNIIKFQGANNILTLKGTNNLTMGDTSVSMYYNTPINSALINVGDGLTVEGDSDGTLNLKLDFALQSLIVPTGAGIGSNLGEASTADIYINSGTINIDMDTDPSEYYTLNTSTGAGIGSGGGGSIGEIHINGATLNITSGNGACIGSGGPNLGSSSSTFLKATAGDIIIDNGAKIRAYSLGNGAAIGSGQMSSSRGNIIIGNSTIEAISDGIYGGAGIGSGGRSASIGNITIYADADISSIGKDGAGIGSGDRGSAGDILMSRYAKINAESTRGSDIGAGRDGTVGTIGYLGTFNPLIIHHGTKANQALNCYINDMRTDALGLSNTKVSTRDDAIWALSNDKTGRVGAIDAAINYALDEATTIGAYISRLAFTEENLVTANENTQSSESTIRDADMAKEMTDYTKSNVLAQSAQSMLAQANQNSSNVLSLLQ